uniref:Xin actin-binding repeat-containing protein 1-like n=1 Tax=Nothobranchius furzeri TaxID=105023 RepID=A0A8C6PF77_NOTFU
MSKVTNQGANNKTEQVQPRESGQKVKPTKIKEDFLQKMDDPPPFQPDEHVAELEQSQQLKPAQLSKQKLHQQRQKSELKRLLKHTHPELRMLDDVVDEEFAEVLSSETATVGETGYEGEVLSRCLIFENCGSSADVPPYTKNHMVHKGEEGCDSSENIPDDHKENTNSNDFHDLRPDFNDQVEEEMTRVDVQATRRMFESQSKSNPEKVQGNVSIILDKEKIKKSNKHSVKENVVDESKPRDLVDEPQGPCGPVSQTLTQHQHSGGDDFEDNTVPYTDLESGNIKTSATLLQNNPFISTNIEKEISHERTSMMPNQNITAREDCLTANVKNRTHLFESMPFDKIRHQNWDDIETMMENIKETLNFLFQVKAIQSSGTIIEVNETMRAKKAKFILSEGVPEINYDEVAEGGAQNFIVQLLPRVNLKPQITYLKEDKEGSMKAAVVDVLVHQHQFNPNKDTEFKTANVVQLVEDILNQDNSLRKGVIIQEDAAVLVYSLYKYFDEEDVKSYSPPKPADYKESETVTGCMSKTDETSTKSGPQETSEEQTCWESTWPRLKVNVKLFKSCIEKGDLEYLKSLQGDEPTAETEEPSQNKIDVEWDEEPNQEQRGDLSGDGISEYAPVDVKRLKSIFSEDKNQIQGTCFQSAITSNASGKRQSSNECNVRSLHHQHAKNTFRENEDVPQDDGRVYQAELADVVNDVDENCDLQTAIQDLQQATKEAKSLYQSFEESQKICTEEKSDGVKLSRTEMELSQENIDAEVKSGMELSWNKPLLTSDITSEHESEWKHKNSDDNPEKLQTAETCRTALDEKQPNPTSHSSHKMPQPEEEEVVFEGKIQAALESLEKSNINVTRGDFRAAMIYRNASNSHQRTSQTNKNQNTTELRPAQVQPEQEVTETVHGPNTVVSKQTKTPIGPKPPLPPKPEHLKSKQGDTHPATTINPETTEIFTVRTKETAPHVPQSCIMQNKQPLIKSTNESMTGHESLDNDKQTLQQSEPRHQVQVNLESIAVNGQQTKAGEDPERGNMNETEEHHIDFHGACQKFEGKKAISVKTAPVKPKRQKCAKLNVKNPKYQPGGNTGDQSVLTNPSTRGITTEREDKSEKDTKQVSKVEMREKKGRTETEDERRQRLSIHMDEIVRGNVVKATEIFDNLRKQEQLQIILSRVEEIEQDTSKVDVPSLRRVFESVPEWVVGPNKKKQKNIRSRCKEKPVPSPPDKTESKSSMEHVYGDLERASEEIINLKEQTLARLKDIEDTIRKALYSVSALKSDSDIAGLSRLLKESMGTFQGPLSSGNSREMNTQEAQESVIPPQNTSASAIKQQIPPSNPPTLSLTLQSAIRKMDENSMEAPTCLPCLQSPKAEERFRTTKTFKCNSSDRSEKGRQKQGHSQQDANQEMSVLEVQTDHEGKSIMGTKTVSENYERTDNSGNKVYTSKTSTVLGQALPSRHSTHPQFHLSEIPTSLSRDVLSLSEASLPDGKNHSRQIRVSQMLLLL